MTYSISELFSYFGGILGIILSLILLTKAKGAFTVRISLALYLITGSAIVILGPIIYSGKILSFPHLIRVDSPIHYLFAALGFFFVYSAFKPDFRFRWIYLLNFLPFLINLIEFTPFYLKDAAYKVAYYNNYIATNGSISMPVHHFLKGFLGLIYCILQFYVFFRYKPKQSSQAGDFSKSFIWFRIFLTTEALLFTLIFTNIMSGLHLFKDPYHFSITVGTSFIYIIALALLFSPQMLYGNPTMSKAIPIKKKYVWSKLNEEEKSAILDKFKKFLQDGNKPYSHPTLSLQEVSIILDVNPGQLSQVINEKTGLNFKDYLNTYRIEEAKLLLSSSEYQKLTIEAIAEKAGFNSKSPFYTAFKRQTGLTPKEFLAKKRSGLLPV